MSGTCSIPCGVCTDEGHCSCRCPYVDPFLADAPAAVVSPLEEEVDTTSVSYRQRPDVVAVEATARLRAVVESGGAR